MLDNIWPSNIPKSSFSGSISNFCLLSSSLLDHFQCGTNNRPRIWLLGSATSLPNSFSMDVLEKEWQKTKGMFRKFEELVEKMQELGNRTCPQKFWKHDHCMEKSSSRTKEHHLLMLFSVHGSPGKLRGLQAIVEVTLTFWVGEQEDLQWLEDVGSDPMEGQNSSK